MVARARIPARDTRDMDPERPLVSPHRGELGRVTAGMDVVKKIEADAGDPATSRVPPKATHTMTSVRSPRNRPGGPGFGPHLRAGAGIRADGRVPSLDWTMTINPGPTRSRTTPMSSRGRKTCPARLHAHANFIHSNLGIALGKL